METKDVVTVTISSLAFLLSFVATILALVRSSHEKQRAIKKEITELMGKLVATKLEGAKLYREHSGKDPAYFQAVSSILNQQNAFLINQATYLIDQVPRLVTAVEYNTIATATAETGDFVFADKYFHKAIDTSPPGYYRSLAIRSYAAHLFVQRRFAEGREAFRTSLSLLTGSSVEVRFTNGVTYQNWGWQELHNGRSPALAEPLFEKAADEFKGIENEMIRTNALNGLAAARSPVVPAFAPPLGPPPTAAATEVPPSAERSVHASATAS